MSMTTFCTRRVLLALSLAAFSWTAIAQEAPQRGQQGDQRPQQGSSGQQHPQRNSPGQKSQGNTPQQNHAQPQQQGHSQPQQHSQNRQQHSQQGAPARHSNNSPENAHGNDNGRNSGGARSNFQFRSQDRNALRAHYQGGFGQIDRAHRPHFARGGYIPNQYRRYFQPIPPDLMRELPPVPPGYTVGYWDGYCVVYNPRTWVILNLIDLF